MESVAQETVPTETCTEPVETVSELVRARVAELFTITDPSPPTPRNTDPPLAKPPLMLSEPVVSDASATLIVLPANSSVPPLGTARPLPTPAVVATRMAPEEESVPPEIVHVRNVPPGGPMSIAWGS